jgi:hypothetical protein
MKVLFGQTEKIDPRTFGCKILDRVIIDADGIDVDDDSFAIGTLQVSFQLR